MHCACATKTLLNTVSVAIRYICIYLIKCCCLRLNWAKHEQGTAR